MNWTPLSEDISVVVEEIEEPITCPIFSICKLYEVFRSE